MSDTNETTDKPAGGRRPLQLKRTVESGHVQQKFGHGRSKSVVVEKKRKRSVAAPGAAPAPVPAAPEAAQPAKPAVAKRGSGRGGAPQSRSAVKNPSGLSEGELAARAKALAAAQVRAKDDERRRTEEAERKAAEDAERAAREKAEAESERRRLNDEAIRKATDQVIVERPKPTPAKPTAEEAAAESASTAGADPAQGESETRDADRAPARGGRSASGGEAGGTRPSARAGDRDSAPRPARTSRASEPVLDAPVGMIAPIIVTRSDRANPKAPVKPDVEVPRRAPRTPGPAPAARDDDDGTAKRKAGGKTARGPGRGGDGRVRGKLTISNALDERQRERSLASLKRKREREKQRAMGIDTSREKISREVIIPEVITIQDLANRMTERAVELIKFMMKQGAMHKINDVIDADTAELIVEEFGHTPKRVSEADVEEGFFGGNDDEGALATRPPVVTIMGHVDHGKTSLLDALRSTTVASGEAGGITQHIGAYQVVSPSGQKITFIDTPGHAAFTAMRARGAKVTDIVILVVAADDGVMPQTIEAINHAKAAEVPMIVAINKIDKPNVDPNRVRTELLQHEVVVESMSGDVLEVEVSATERLNLDTLLESIALQSELLDLKANPDRSAEGFVIEAKLERGRGPVGTLLVQRGKLAVGDIVVAGMSWGRVRALIDDQGKNVAVAGPSFPVEVLGFDQAPEAGDQFAVVESEARAREITEYRIRKRRETLGAAGSARTLEQMMQQLKEAGEKQEFPLVVKGDVQGSVEAIAGALQKLSTDEVEARIIHSGVGGITESDVTLANASNAVVIGFNTRANQQAKQAAERDGVEIRYYNIIYDLVDDVRGVMSGMLAPTIREIFLGNASVRQVFNISKVGKVAGCVVTDGKVERGAKVRLIRDNVVIHEGTLSMLKRFKDDVKEVQGGQECGMSFANYQDLKEGDVIECFQVEEIARTLDG